MSPPPSNDFEKAAATEKGGTFLGELWDFLTQSKKWWLMPILGALLLIGLVIILGGTALAPFIYTLF